jgi:hypothetical protein
VWKISPDGTQLYWNALMDGGEFLSLATPGDGTAWVCGTTWRDTLWTSCGAYMMVPPPFTGSQPYPVVSLPFPRNETYDALLAHFRGLGSFDYSTLLGGQNKDLCWSVMPLPDGSVRVAGSTLSAEFPVTSSPQGTLASARGFVSTLTDGVSRLRSSIVFGAEDPFTAAGAASEPGGEMVVPGQAKPATSVYPEPPVRTLVVWID